MKQIIFFFESIGGYCLLLLNVLKNVIYVFQERNRVITQMSVIGVNALPLVALISIFTGAIAVWQVAYQIEGFSTSEFVGGVATRIIILELSPVLTGMIIAGRVGASVAAELATMKTTEQLDALIVMGLTPSRYLAMPRVVATTLMMPVIVMIGTVVAILGAFAASVTVFEISAGSFFSSVKSFFFVDDLSRSLFKSSAFGFLISMTGCFSGFRATGGAQGVGNATVNSFVISATLVLACDFVFWFFIFG